MAAVLETKTDAATAAGSQVDEQIAQATSRIRTHDVAFGGLALVALVLAYTTVMIALDRYFVLPAAVRQVAFSGFVALLAGVAYLTLVSPLRRRINPLYAAKQVERTIDDPKNSVTGYVDARQNGDLNPTVKAALASRAAAATAEADVNRAVDHRSLLYLGGVAVVFLIALAVLFFVFRPTQFASLAGRALMPFSTTTIANRTQLTIVKPDPAEPTITTGQSVTVAVYVGGKVPRAESVERVRVLIRHNPTDPNYDELPLVPGATSRDWELRVPDYLVQNGFWYKVAAGDTETPEYKVTVRSLPMFTDFHATYEYPKYLRRKSDRANDPVLRGYRGTTVTLVAKTNRAARDGLMVIEAGNMRVAGTPVAGQPDSLQFVFKLTESSQYRLTFNAADGEHTADAFRSVITVDVDAAPQVVITKPDEDETTEPANGQIKVDGKIGDDFGIDTVTLKMKLVTPVERPLPDVPYLNGKSSSFRRASDDTWPTDLDYKGSVDLSNLKKDAAGLPLTLAPDAVIEYWLEAADNCTEPKANVGRSKAKRVRLTPPVAEENAKENLDQQKEQRQKEEKQHADQQKQKTDTEKREPKQKDNKTAANGKKDDPKPDNNGEGKKEEGKQVDSKQENGKQGDATQNDSKKDDGGKPGAPKKDDGGMQGDNAAEKNGMNDPTGPPPEAPMPSTPEQKNLDKTADELKNEIDKEKKSAGSAKPNPSPDDENRADPASAKPQPMDGTDGMGNPAEPKPEPKQPGNNAQPKGQQDNAPGASKPEGDLKKSDNPAASKPEPKQPDPKDNAQKNAAPAENRNEPAGAPPGTDKETPKEPQPAPKDASQKQDPNSGSAAKPQTQKKDDQPAGTPNASDKPDPAADAGSQAKPMPEPKRGDEKPSASPKETQTQGTPDAGDAKPETSPPAGDAKPKPKDDGMGKGMDTDPKPAEGANDQQKPNGTNAAEARPDAAKNPPKGGGKGVEKGTDKREPNAGGNDAPMPKPKLDEKQKQELEQAAKDLAGNDPKKKQEARDKLDKAVGEEKRKEREQLADDLKSDDKGKREAAEKKLENLKKELDKQNGGEPKEGDAPKLDEKQKQVIENAVKDLQSNDPAKKEQAQKKLDKMVGEDARKEAEQLMNDLKSDDKTKREAAQKKIDDFKKEMEKQAKKDGKGEPKGKQLTEEELADLTKKAQELQSKDDKTRQQAEKELDDKIGKENREKLQEQLKNPMPTDGKDAEKLKEQLEQMAKNPPKKPDDFNPKGLGSGTEAKGLMEEDEKNRLKSAELRLIDFEKNRFNKELQSKKGWTQEEYDRFLEGYRNRVEQMRDEVKKPSTAGPADPAAPLFNPGGSGKVDALPGAAGGPAGVGGTTAAPPGFEGAREKFLKALNKKP